MFLRTADEYKPWIFLILYEFYTLISNKYELNLGQKKKRRQKKKKALGTGTAAVHQNINFRNTAVLKYSSAVSEQ